ncbi:MAG: acylneuraminate cytidylyltransferase family protein [Alphaproteobacteria bacterium]
MNALCVIAARGGSTGLPGKNIRPMLGKPLIAWSIEQALSIGEFTRVVVSTDSPDIAEVARAAGAEVPFMRPDALSDAGAGKFQVWQHALDASQKHFGERYEILVDLDCTGPLRERSDVVAALAQFSAGRGRGLDAICSVCPARKNPYFNLVEPDGDGWLRISKPLDTPILARQSAPPVYEHIAALYVLDADYLRRADFLFEGHCEGYDLGQEKGFDIDTETDFFIIESLLRRRLEKADQG